ncbi:Hypothetical_protein [Hexamita inflata]|uniref:Hypothetical_protein n=1 Tax=Hexamita inflata TaxID=28002 RepID=A0AA86PIK1_9EUKA|nr:Hypothetical protein HINF_LOCUS26711 [Hexamita inflata]
MNECHEQVGYVGNDLIQMRALIAGIILKLFSTQSTCSSVDSYSLYEIKNNCICQPEYQNITLHLQEELCESNGCNCLRSSCNYRFRRNYQKEENAKKEAQNDNSGREIQVSQITVPQIADVVQ